MARSVRCKVVKKNGEPCGRWARLGATVCPAHGGNAPQVKAAAARRVERRKAEAEVARLMARTTPDTALDPADALKVELDRSSAEVEALAQLVEQLDGVTTKDGAIAPVVKWFAEARDRHARMAALGAQLGLAERRVQVAEEQARLVAAVVRSALCDAELGLTPEQRELAPSILRRHMAELPMRASNGAESDPG